METLLEVDDLQTAYGSSQILFGVGLSIGAGQVATLLGRNGMGKTTTVRSILGLTRARGGSVRFLGERIDQLPADRIARMGMAVLLRAGSEARVIIGALLSALEKRRAHQAKRERPSRLAPTPEEREALDAARVSSYPAVYPTGWIPLLPDTELRREPVAVHALGRSLVVFRGESGAITVMDAFCPHLGAHLALGHVCGEALTCRFHGWQFANTGEVVSVPYGKRSPARVGVHPSEVYYGMICAYLAPAGVSAVAPYALGRMPEIDDH